MSETEPQLLAWMEELQQYHLPRWEELPDIELYMDQVITLIERYLSPLVGQMGGKVITPAMINNYVKLAIMPKPNKKRYARVHLAYLIVITILKQVLLIPDIKQGIFLQANINGISDAYNLFCEEQEDAIQAMITTYSSQPATISMEQVALNRLGLHMACVSFASKIFTEKIIFLRMQEHTKQEHSKTEKKVL